MRRCRRQPDDRAAAAWSTLRSLEAEVDRVRRLVGAHDPVLAGLAALLEEIAAAMDDAGDLLGAPVGGCRSQDVRAPKVEPARRARSRR
jgi:glyoxylase-like metal-dependent hydrolase (beta-lactamase superfamily II)